MRSDAERVDDILDAIAKIEARAPGDLAAFLADELLQIWVIHHLQTIGEAARCISPSFRERYAGVPWPQIVALRNLLVHEYFGLNLHQVWAMVQKDLPKLQEQVVRIRSEIRPG